MDLISLLRPWLVPALSAAAAVALAVIAIRVRLTGAIAEAVALRFPADVADKLQARRVLTQTRLLTRTLASSG